ncbi:MAG: molybdenum cofactor biosynthesis protein MoaE [Vicinamibacterales bacterium]|nr:molybdenum cofactor biosynthesis protein MoaE [Vicinamibacterales bacterium]
MPAPLVAVTSAPLDATALAAAVSVDGEGLGAVTTFAGLVRDHNVGRRVLFLEYEAYDTMALSVMQVILNEATEHWPGIRLGMHHRTGRLEIGEASIIIVAASAHRADAFAACRYAIERVKQILPVWKHEHFEGGDVWLEGATVHPEDTDARQKAYGIACA